MIAQPLPAPPRPHQSRPGQSRPAWILTTWVLAAAGSLLLCAAFAPEIAAAVTVWNQSTAYGHCWLVLPIVGWLLWERRAVIASISPHPTAWPALAAIPLALAWLAADWLGIMEGRQLAFAGFVELLLLAALGWRLWWALSPAFLYLLFLVPFGAFLTPALQRFTTGFIIAGLRLLDIPFAANAFQITIPEGVFYVAEACAGLRFLIASVAFGVLYAVTIFRSPWRRAAFIAVACVVPVIANGFRGLGIVLLGHALGSAQAGAADHLIYGWVFFSFVIVLLALSGLPFREDTTPRQPGTLHPTTPTRWQDALAACVPILLLAYAGPVAMNRLARPDATSAATIPHLDLPAGCLLQAATTAGPVSTQHVRCGDIQLTVTATSLSARASPARIVAAARDPAAAGISGSAEDDEYDSEVWHTPSGAPWTLLTAHETGVQAAYTVVSGGKQLTGGLGDRLRMTRHMSQGLAIAVITSPAPLSRLQAFLTLQNKMNSRSNNP